MQEKEMKGEKKVEEEEEESGTVGRKGRDKRK